MVSTNKRIDNLERKVKPKPEKYIAFVSGDGTFNVMEQRITREEYNRLYPGRELITVRFIRPNPFDDRG